MGKRKKSQIVGYRYHLGAHLIACHGPVDAVTEVQIDERVAWSGNLTASGQIAIDQPGLFGGDMQGGGVSGAVDVEFGSPSQAPNAYLAQQIGTPLPSHRGVLGLILRQVYIGTAPQVRPWAVRVKRCPRAWYPAKAEIGGAANPAHIIRECLTNPEWGMGYPDHSIDDARFTAAADVLFAEGFGLNMIWAQQSTIERFVLDVLDHIGGVLTVSPFSGRFVLRLVRADYAPSALPVFDPDSIIEMESFQRAGWGETVNEITVTYTDAATGRDRSLTVHNLANIQTQGGVVAQTRRYPGITSDALAARVAMRDLAIVSSPLAKVRLRVNRRAWSLQPGDVFRLTWPPLGVASIIMRVADVDGGTLTDGTITVDAVEDVFGMPSSAYTAPQSGTWTDPLPMPMPVMHSRIWEMPYWDIARAMSAADLAYLDPTDCYLASIAVRPSTGAISYVLHSKPASATEWGNRGRMEFAPSAILPAGLAQEHISTVAYHSGIDLDLVKVGNYAIVGDEVVQVTAHNPSASTLTLARGVLDTVPAAHSAGVRILFADGWLGVDTTEYAPGDVIQMRMLTMTGRGTLAPSSAPTDSVTANRRQNRPYPPGNVRVNSQSFPAAVSGDLVIAWSHRNRITQTADIIHQTVGDIGPETGVTYTVRARNRTGVVVRTVTGITGTSWTWDIATASADAGVAGDRVTIEIESVRGGVTSWQAQTRTVDRAGYGFHWGNYYGGV